MRNNDERVHDLLVEGLSVEIKNHAGSLALQHNHSHNTTRSKSYKHHKTKLDLGGLKHVLHIDQEGRLAHVEPRVTMEELVRATLAYGLFPAVIPEFKGITVGGAIMGGAGESASHHYGLFNDLCTEMEILCGDGRLLQTTGEKERDLFYGLPGSYGSLGVLVSAKIKLIPAKKTDVIIANVPNFRSLI